MDEETIRRIVREEMKAILTKANANKEKRLAQEKEVVQSPSPRSLKE